MTQETLDAIRAWVVRWDVAQGNDPCDIQARAQLLIELVRNGDSWLRAFVRYDRAMGEVFNHLQSVAERIK